MMEELGKKRRRCFFTECSPVIISQVNLSRNFLGEEGRLINFFAPYYCSACENEKIYLIETRDALDGKPFSPPPCRCNECDHLMEFGESEAYYFDFLKTLKNFEYDPTIIERSREFWGDDLGRIRAFPTLRTIPSLGIGRARSADSKESQANDSAQPKMFDDPLAAGQAGTLQNDAQKNKALNSKLPSSKEHAPLDPIAPREPQEFEAEESITKDLSLVTEPKEKPSLPENKPEIPKSESIIIKLAIVMGAICVLGILAYMFWVK